MKELSFSIIIAVFERKEELTELLNSLVAQTYKDFEVIIVDDGSPNPLTSTCENFKNELNLYYYYKENSGPGKSRNYGIERANGNYFIFLDSDVIVPKDYMSNVKQELEINYTDAFGGPDGADKTFTNLQKAITFSMTSILTTGGIRGGKNRIGKFQPRSFNMGISREVYNQIGGFSDLRVGEDPDLSMTIWENGFETRLLESCKVVHKRRTSIKKFAKQVYQFGIARPILNQRHPTYTKITFWFPSTFFIGSVLSLLMYLFYLIISDSYIILKLPICLLLTYLFIIFINATIRFRSLLVGGYSLLTTIVQFFFYGFGFLESQFKINILKKDSKEAFPRHFHSN